MSHRTDRNQSEARDALLERAPNLFVIGAAKAGTTALYHLLESHPQIFLPRIKEPHFFSNDLVFKEGLQWYVDTHFRNAAGFPARVDATPHYLYYRKAAERIAEILPSSHHRFIVMLRNPVDRAYSLYWNMVHEGHETESFQDAVAKEADRSSAATEELGTVRHQYLDSGRYAAQLSNWFEIFDRERFLIILDEDLAADPSDVMERVSRFAGIPDTHKPIQGTRANAAGQPRSRFIQRYFRRPDRFRHVLGKLVPFHFKRALVTAILERNRRSFQYPPMTDETRASLIDYFRQDLQHLEQLIDRPLRHWYADDEKRTVTSQPRR
jgi:hypothetical protein